MANLISASHRCGTVSPRLSMSPPKKSAPGHLKNLRPSVFLSFRPRTPSGAAKFIVYVAKPKLRPPHRRWSSAPPGPELLPTISNNAVANSLPKIPTGPADRRPPIRPWPATCHRASGRTSAVGRQKCQGHPKRAISTRLFREGQCRFRAPPPCFARNGAKCKSRIRHSTCRGGQSQNYSQASSW